MDLHSRLREAWEKNEARRVPPKVNDGDGEQPANAAPALRQQLQRAWQANRVLGKQQGHTSTTSNGVRGLDEVLQGLEVVTGSGPTYVREWRYPLDHRHGHQVLNRYQQLHGSLDSSRLPFSALSADSPDGAPDWTRGVFFDTETTGLSGGTGTYIILAGLGYFDAGEFVIRQFFLRDYNEEPAMLAAVQSDLASRSALITFNGRGFDVPLLSTRLTLAGTELPGALNIHWDLLHSARRVYGWRLDSCALSSIEQNVLQFRRDFDVPGAEIPGRYFAYLREGDASFLEGVAEHNRDDILSLVSLASTLLELAADPHRHNNTAHDLLGLARAYELEGQFKLAADLYHKGLEALPAGQAVAGTARLRLARLRKRLDDYEGAVAAWHHLLETEPTLLEPSVELAKFYEHRAGRLERALQLVEHALHGRRTPREQTELVHRRNRLERKLAQQSE